MSEALLDWSCGMRCTKCSHETQLDGLGPRPDLPSMQDIIAMMAQARHLDTEAARDGDPRCTVCHAKGALWWTGALAGDSHTRGGGFAG